MNRRASLSTTYDVSACLLNRRESQTADVSACT